MASVTSDHVAFGVVTAVQAGCGHATGFQYEPSSGAAPLRQAGIGVAMHGGVRSVMVGRTSTRSDLIPAVPDRPAGAEHPDALP